VGVVEEFVPVVELLDAVGIKDDRSVEIVPTL
jgi:hypothetical protein